METQIKQIAAAAGEPICGLGEDGLVYLWTPTPVGKWELYGNTNN